MARMSSDPEKPHAGDRPFPPPQISDLLVLTLTVAYGMTWMGAFQSEPPSAGADWQSHLNQLATTLLPGLLFGVELFGFAVVVRELARGRRFKSLAPGHWWFLITGPEYLLGGTNYLIAILGNFWFENQQGLWRMMESLSDAAFYGCFAGFWLWAAASLRGRPWRVVLGLKALEQLVRFAYRFHRAFRGFAWVPRISFLHFFGLMGTIHIGMILFVLVAALADRRTQTRRDWLHHLAAIAIVGESLQLLFGGFGAYAVEWWSEIWLRLVG
jgi:hypothetical protein